jgi:signal recognition particle subunit SRP54
MFTSLSERLSAAFKKIRGRGVLTKQDVESVLRDVRMALLEADVNYKVAKELCDRISEKAIGIELLKSLSPDQHIIKLVHEELITTLGSSASEINFKVSPPLVIMLVGLQGSGKTTSCGKLARLLRDEYKRRVLLVPADVYRPAAITQLKTLAKQLSIDVFDSNTDQDPVFIAKKSIEEAQAKTLDTVIIDTAGRLQIDAELMNELREISDSVAPHEILLVADGMTGQEALNVAKGFDEALEIDGLILTKLDGDARGGAALSMRAVTGKPIKFIGVGEKLDALNVFHPERMASRILGMGDVLSLIEKATKEVTLEDSKKLEEKFKKNQFTFEDFLSQLKMIKRMGSFSSLISMIPGMSKMAAQVDPEKAEKEMKKVEAIILSMTPKERNVPNIIDGSRRKRIAKGSGTSVEEVNRLLKQFLEMKKVMAKVSKIGLGGMMNMMRGGL